MADLLYMVAIQQLEAAVLDSPAAKTLDTICTGMGPTTGITFQQPGVCPWQPHMKTPMTPPPTEVPIAGVTELSSETSAPLYIQQRAGAPEISETTEEAAKWQHIMPTPVPVPEALFTGSTSSYPVVVMPELAIPAEVYSEHINRPHGGKDYHCHICPFKHTNSDCMLTHIRRDHLNITMGCPECGQGFQNAA